MSDDTQQPIVVKKIKKGGGGAHGGAWKIAYADFMTAMFAFFLLMWLLNLMSEKQLGGIAEYFAFRIAAHEHGAGKPDPGIFLAACEQLGWSVSYRHSGENETLFEVRFVPDSDGERV